MTPEETQKAISNSELIPQDAMNQKACAAILKRVSKQLHREEHNRPSSTSRAKVLAVIGLYRPLGAKTVMSMVHTLNKLARHDSIDSYHLQELSHALIYAHHNP